MKSDQEIQEEAQKNVEATITNLYNQSQNIGGQPSQSPEAKAAQAEAIAKYKESHNAWLGHSMTVDLVKAIEALEVKLDDTIDQLPFSGQSDQYLKSRIVQRQTLKFIKRYVKDGLVDQFVENINQLGQQPLYGTQAAQQV